MLLSHKYVQSKTRENPKTPQLILIEMGLGFTVIVSFFYILSLDAHRANKGFRTPTFQVVTFLVLQR
jgi:hypothetical protein